MILPHLCCWVTACHIFSGLKQLRYMAYIYDLDILKARTMNVLSHMLFKVSLIEIIDLIKKISCHSKVLPRKMLPTLLMVFTLCGGFRFGVMPSAPTLLGQLYMCERLRPPLMEELLAATEHKTMDSKNSHNFNYRISVHFQTSLY